MATTFKIRGDESDLTVTCWLESEGGTVKLCARASGDEEIGADQTLLSIDDDYGAQAEPIECDLLARALGFRNLKGAL